MANLAYKRVPTDQQSTDRQNLVLTRPDGLAALERRYVGLGNRQRGMRPPAAR
ncbi:hypothetical protein [Streptomyces sp. NBC_01233]|uniref:hypothetical protein n=1 Tax=Streptomyces sp. NBC_01233 TaxID=2903787 RepID=UPI002E0E391A|nr:hypothetical protein OG332_02000 [Streptomyces sp. NBC_01233]